MSLIFTQQILGGFLKLFHVGRIRQGKGRKPCRKNAVGNEGEVGRVVEYALSKRQFCSKKFQVKFNFPI
jgi:hypothetical protein